MGRVRSSGCSPTAVASSAQLPAQGPRCPPQALLPPSPTSPPPPQLGAERCCCPRGSQGTDLPPSGQSLTVALAPWDPGPREGWAQAQPDTLERLRPGQGQTSGVDTRPPPPRPGRQENEGPRLLLPVGSHRPRERPDDGPPACWRGHQGHWCWRAIRPWWETPPRHLLWRLSGGRSHSRAALRQGLHTRPPPGRPTLGRAGGPLEGDRADAGVQGP